MTAASAPVMPARTQPAPEIRILVTAVDKDQNFVNSLRREDLRVLEDGASRENSNNNARPSRKIQIEIVNPALRNRDLQLAYPRLAYQSIAPRK